MGGAANTLQCTGQRPAAKNHAAPNVNSDEDGIGRLSTRGEENYKTIVPEARPTEITEGHHSNQKEYAWEVFKSQMDDLG